MRMPSSSSMILATLASSASLSSMVAAAPTDSPDSRVASAPGHGASAAGDLSGILGLPGMRREVREVRVEARQLGGVVDTAANMVPLVDAVLGALGLQRKNAMTTDSVLPQAQLSQIQDLVKQAVPGGLPVPLPALPVGGGAPAAPNAARAEMRREVRVEARQLGGVVDTAANMVPLVDAVLDVLGLQRKNAMTTDSVLPQALLGQIQDLVKQAVPGGLPVPLPGLPVGGGGAAPAPPAAPNAARAEASWAHEGQISQDTNALPVQFDAVPAAPAPPAGAPAPPVSAPAPPVGAPAPPVPLPVGGNNGSTPSAPSAPFSPPLPANPPNTPNPPLFAGASADEDSSEYDCMHPGDATSAMN